jgi:hypothetical protein
MRVLKGRVGVYIITNNGMWAVLLTYPLALRSTFTSKQGGLRGSLLYMVRY